MSYLALSGVELIHIGVDGDGVIDTQKVNVYVFPSYSRPFHSLEHDTMVYFISRVTSLLGEVSESKYIHLSFTHPDQLSYSI